jgi:hypothetical protein
MEFPNFCLSYMANIGQLPSTQGHMTHLSWDESGPCVLENGTILAGAGTYRRRVGWMENT